MNTSASTEFTVVIHLLNREALSAYAIDLGHADETDDFVEKLTNAVVNAENSPLDIGYEIVSKTAEIHGDNASVRVVCNVIDAEAVVAEARECYAANFFDHEWKPETVEEALYEILVASNPNPSPTDIGYEIVDYSSPVKTPAPVSPAPTI